MFNRINEIDQTNQTDETDRIDQTKKSCRGSTAILPEFLGLRSREVAGRRVIQQKPELHRNGGSPFNARDGVEFEVFGISNPVLRFAPVSQVSPVPCFTFVDEE